MTNTPWRHAALSVLVVLSVGGCAFLPKASKWAAVRPASSAEASQVSAVDRDYAGAVAAISRKDYVRALQLLQAARAQQPDDIRVLNAFGVVYDKLGRFDLSARYYAQVAALDADSPVLANNMAYSSALKLAVAQPVVLEPVALPAEIISSPPPVTLAAAPMVVRLSASSPAAIHRTLPARSGLVGRPLYIANATGRQDAAEPVRAHLVRLGWSAPRLGVHQGPARSRTTIRYPATTLVAAKALARTLPPGVQMQDCGAACQRIELTLGADSLAWPVRSPRVAARKA